MITRLRSRLARFANPILLGALLTLGAAPRKGAPLIEPLKDAGRLLRKASESVGPEYTYARDMGAKIAATPDGRSFYVAWGPDGPDDLSKGPVIVTLHDKGGWAFDGFFRWHPYAEKRGYGLIAVQWEFGRGPKNRYTSPQLHELIAWALAARGVQAHRNLLHGAGGGAAHAYGVAWLDARDGNRFFELAVADAGAATQDAPTIAALASGRYGTQAFSGTHWVLFCGERHRLPDPRGCDAMRRTRTWLESFGGTVEQLLSDETADRGMLEHPERLVELWKVFDRLVPRDRL